VRLSDGEIRDEIQGSRDDLAEILGRRPETFAYPFGWYDQRPVDVATELFALSFTTREGLATADQPRAERRRLMVGNLQTSYEILLSSGTGFSPTGSVALRPFGVRADA
jgi:peptidoglycan/xylan/chitin deacetylase (PgdA/CDA1 family)